MNKYTIITDTACDISPALLKKWGVEYINLTYRFDGEDIDYTSDKTDIKRFYNKMREGGVAKTAAINPDTFENEFEKCLKKGYDILYLGFSSGLSTTYNSSQIAANELAERYPNQKIITVDTLCASAGQGLFVYLVAEEKKKGATIEQAAEYANKLVPNLCHWFTVDDLVYLKRGGRISPTTAFVGTVLNIKPVLHVDNEGKLINMTKARGRKMSIRTLAEKFGEFANDKKNGTIFISHADCEDDAKMLAQTIKESYGSTVDVITNIGPVIGAHTGPGALALFFVGKER